jgi:prepilin-type processing-associated H-X9-DG protein
LDLGAASGPSGTNNPANVSYTYNGLLMAYPEAGMVQPSQLPLVTESLGSGYIKGFQAPNPFLFCPLPAACSYQPPSNSCSQNVNGQQSGWFGFVGSAGVHAQGQTFAYADGHVKFKHLSLNVLAPNGTTDYNQEPWYDYNTDGTPAGAWWDGCHIYYFEPDNPNIH